MEDLTVEQSQELEEIVAMEGSCFWRVCDFCDRHGFRLEDIVGELVLAGYSVGYAKAARRFGNPF